MRSRSVRVRRMPAFMPKGPPALYMRPLPSIHNMFMTLRVPCFLHKGPMPCPRAWFMRSRSVRVWWMPAFMLSSCAAPERASSVTCEEGRAEETEKVITRRVRLSSSLLCYSGQPLQPRDK